MNFTGLLNFIFKLPLIVDFFVFLIFYLLFRLLKSGDCPADEAVLSEDVFNELPDILSHETAFDRFRKRALWVVVWLGVPGLSILLLLIAWSIAPLMNKYNVYNVCLPSKTVCLRHGFSVGEVEALINQKLKLQSEGYLRDYKYCTNDFGTNCQYKFVFYKDKLDAVDISVKFASLPAKRSSTRKF